MAPYTAFFVFGGVAVLVGIIWFINNRMEQRRVEALRQTAEEMGFSFEARPGDSFANQFPGFQLFSQGHNRVAKNLLQGKALGLEVDIFDYSYVTGSGKNRHTWQQTVLAFEIDGAALPMFSLRPETVFDKIGQWFGYQDIDFESHPKFSRSYVLRGQDEQAVRELFGDRVLDYFEESPACCTEGGGNRLVYYRARTRVAPAKVRKFMEEGFRVLALFRPPVKESNQ
jgi:hypothetical protein